MNQEAGTALLWDLCANKEEQKKCLRCSGDCFIRAFQKLFIETKASKDDMRYYMQKVLHSIFFLGHINDPQVRPEEFFPKVAYEQMKMRFPEPFQRYQTHLPGQTPYSILLEYVAKVLDSENHESIMEGLVKVNRDLRLFYEKEGNQAVANDFALSASVVTHSHSVDPNSPFFLKKAYGASISYKGKVPRRIMIAISTLYVWDKAVAYAVCCGDRGRGIKFPTHVHCYAHKFNTVSLRFERVPPCIKCHKMFVVTFDPQYEKADKSQDWPYGNCAETECLSNLLHANEAVRNEVCTINDEEEQVCRRDIEEKFIKEYVNKTRKEVKNLLQGRKFKVPLKDWQLFCPAA